MPSHITLLKINETDKILDSLEIHGCALIDANIEGIKDVCGLITKATFEFISESSKKELEKGNFSDLAKDLQKSNYNDLQISMKGNGMINQAPLDKDYHDSHKNKSTDTIHTKNMLNSMIGPVTWLFLDKIGFDYSIFEKDGCRTLVPDDGIKIWGKKGSYNPTKPHTDNQLLNSGSSGNSGSSDRLQMVYLDDKGPIKLFVVPKEHYFVSNSEKTGFSVTEDHSEYIKHGVSIHGKGLMIFKPGILHFENTVSHFSGGLAFSDNDFDEKRIKKETVKAEIFRIYCGIIRTPYSEETIKILKDLAYLRYRGWSFDPFAVHNSKNIFFVNRKSTRFTTVTYKPKEPLPKCQENYSLKTFTTGYPLKTLQFFGLKEKDF